MAASKVEILISQLVHQITTKFHRYAYTFYRASNPTELLATITTEPEETGVGISKMMAPA